MHKSSLLDIMRTFSKEELVKFEDFISSPYFNKKETLVKLFLIIRNYSPEYVHESLAKEKVWKSLFPETKYNYGIIKNLIHDLSKLINKFIELENYSGKKFDSDMNLLEQYFLRKQHGLFEKKLNQTYKNIDSVHPSSEIYYKKFLLGVLEFRYLIIKNNLKAITDFNFMDLNKNLNLSYYSNFFIFNGNLFHFRNMYKMKTDDKFIPDIIRSYNKSGFKNYYSEMFYLAFIVVSDPFNETNYNKLKSLYYENFNKLNDYDKYILTITLHNFCMNNSNKGNIFYVKERYQYNKALADNNLLTIIFPGTVDRYVFMTTVIAACAAEEFEWCMEFIEKYKSKLDADIQEQYVNFAYTQLNFKQKNFEKALVYLSKCDNARAMDKINIKTFQFYLYYELKYYEELRNLADASKHFIKNDKTISPETKLIFNKFIEAVIKLNEFRYKIENGDADGFAIKEIKSFISGNDMTGKNWLNQKISELEKQHFLTEKKIIP